MSFMPIKAVSPIIEMVKPLETLSSANPAGAQSFGSVFQGALGEVRGTRADAERQMTSFMNGEQTDIHQVATSIQKAELTFEMAIEVRNKMMQAYQEVMRMQI